ncbi:thioesterase family protein [Phenylobacterium sp.]|uniref:acyl-CoA thioesterase n=1 Tax=Phenylobacterium sp. TaxID=1871053 RepID=UPI0028111E8B|nr:thioesterase family protein [Phenylobacterium sp.]
MILLEPPEGRQVFRLSFEPTPADIDENGHVNNVVYLRWAQDMGTAHWRSRAPADAQATWAWIALRHEVDYRRALMPGETAQGRTWVSDQAHGPRFDRFIRIDGPDGQMCAQVRTTWVLIEQATGRPRRVPLWMVEMFT